MSGLIRSCLSPAVGPCAAWGASLSRSGLFCEVGAKRSSPGGCTQSRRMRFGDAARARWAALAASVTEPVSRVPSTVPAFLLPLTVKPTSVTHEPHRVRSHGKPPSLRCARTHFLPPPAAAARSGGRSVLCPVPAAASSSGPTPRSLRVPSLHVAVPSWCRSGYSPGDGGDPLGPKGARQFHGAHT